jgi:hypothetical protein
MNKILKLSAIALLASSTSLMAQSKSFSGASIGLSLSAVGAEISGNSTATSGGGGTIGGNNVSSGAIGKVAEIAAIDLSYGFEMGANSVLSIGASYTPGKAKAGSANFTDNNSNNGTSDTGALTVEVKDPYTIYIAPTYVVSKDSALYAKIGYSKADINTSATGGAALSAKPADLEGWTYAIGSKTLLTNNVYVGVEASITDYDSISATTTNGSVINANPKVAQGTITLGYKF